jgi:hypothetical protein
LTRTTPHFGPDRTTGTTPEPTTDTEHTMTPPQTGDPWDHADHDPTSHHPTKSTAAEANPLMSHHTAYGHAKTALYTVYTSPLIATAELGAIDELDGPYVLGLWNDNGDGLALEGSRADLLTYLLAATAAVRAACDPRVDLDQALRRHQHLRDEQAAALEQNRFEDAAFDDDELEILREIAELAQLVADEP